MNSKTFSNVRLKKNLKQLRNVDVRVALELAGLDTFLASSAEQVVEQAAVAILRKNGIRNRNQSGVPDLEIEVSLRPYFEPVSGKSVVVYRVETTLREKVKVDRSGIDSSADTWRHRAEIKYAEASAAQNSTPAILNEVKLQLEDFASDWRQANGFGDAEDARGVARDDLQGLIESLGPVYEKILNDAGVLTLNDLVQLDSEERIIVLDQLKAKSPAITAAKLDGWIGKATDLLD